MLLIKYMLWPLINYWVTVLKYRICKSEQLSSVVWQLDLDYCCVDSFGSSQNVVSLKNTHMLLQLSVSHGNTMSKCILVVLLHWEDISAEFTANSWKKTEKACRWRYFLSCMFSVVKRLWIIEICLKIATCHAFQLVLWNWAGQHCFIYWF